MQLSDFDYHLPADLIAQHPAAERTASRLLHLDGRTGNWVDRQFRDLPSQLRAGDVLVFNNTEVIKARLHGRKSSGGKVEALIERILPGGRRALAHVRASKSPLPGSTLQFAAGFEATMLRRQDDLFELDFGAPVHDVLAQIGEVPLPPYIEHGADADDERRYQTVYALHPGSVAAPTAGLHFDQPMLEVLRLQGVHLAFVTLHVGAGTFRPVRDDDLSRHVMHSEWYDVPAETVALVQQARATGGRVVAVGTTSTRTLEAASAGGTLRAGSGETQIFITPGYPFRTVDRLITNFHLPKSTLMMLVSAFAGNQAIRDAYAHAVAERYRFFSYGDAMLIEPRWPSNVGERQATG